MFHRMINMFHTQITSALFGFIFATGVIVDEKSLVPLGTLGAVCSLVWWVGRKLQRIDDRLEQISKQAEQMEETAKKVASLPCVALGKVCDDPKKPLKML